MKYNFITRYYDAAASEPAGGAPPPLPPSLADISDPNYKPPLTVVDPNPAEPAPPVDPALPADVPPADEPPVDDLADDDPESFWADVNKLHGTVTEVTYPEGVDSLSPEGVYIRDKAVASNAISGFEEYLKKSDPRSYAYMLHRQAGGDDESFYAAKSFSLPEYSTFQASTDLQVRLYKSSLLSKGLEEDVAQMVVDKAVKDGVIFDKADAAYKSAEEGHDRELKVIESQQKDAENKYLSNVNGFAQVLSTTITEGKGMRFIIPDTDKAKFLSYVKEHVEYDSKEGKFLLVQRVGDNLTQQLESMYLMFKNGDLNGLIKNQAQTDNVKRLKRAVDKTKKQTTSGADDNSAKSFIALGSL